MISETKTFTCNHNLENVLATPESTISTYTITLKMSLPDINHTMCYVACIFADISDYKEASFAVESQDYTYVF